MKEGFDKRNNEEKLFVIPVNSCFDTIVDEDISSCSKPLVSPNSLHGRWIKAIPCAKSFIATALNEEDFMVNTMADAKRYFYKL